MSGPPAPREGPLASPNPCPPTSFAPQVCDQPPTPLTERLPCACDRADIDALGIPHDPMFGASLLLPWPRSGTATTAGLPRQRVRRLLVDLVARRWTTTSTSVTADERRLGAGPSAPHDLRLVELTPDNASAYRRLRTHRTQETFVATIDDSFATPSSRSARLPPRPPRRRGRGRGDPAGFLMYATPSTRAPPTPTCVVPGRPPHQGRASPAGAGPLVGPDRRRHTAAIPRGVPGGPEAVQTSGRLRAPGDRDM